MSTLFLLSGFPGSGKSTLASEMLLKDSSALRVNRDDLRSMLFRDRKWSPTSEDFVGTVEKSIVTAALTQKRVARLQSAFPTTWGGILALLDGKPDQLRQRIWHGMRPEHEPALLQDGEDE